MVSSCKPVVIKGKRGNAVLLSENDWSVISETLHLASLSGMLEPIQGVKRKTERLHPQKTIDNFHKNT